MPYRFVRFTPEWEAAAQRCNGRLKASGSSPFLLPDRAVPAPDPEQLLRREHWLVADETDEVRGGCLLQLQPGWVAGEEAEVINIQSPLSEGIADRRHSGVAVWMMKQIQDRYPNTYSVGMGSDQAAYPRLLKALRWRVELAPFYFRVLGGRRLLAHLTPLRRHPRFGLAARIGAFVPLIPDLAFAAVHRMHAAPVQSIPESGRLEWAVIRARYGFAVERSEAILNALYGDAQRFERISMPGATAIVCWAHCRKHPYFGDLKVATLVDVLCQPGAAPSLVRAATVAARAHGADLLITNQTAPDIIDAVCRSGWINYTSNFVVALSPALAAKVGAAPVFVTRGDGDGLLNL